MADVTPLPDVELMFDPDRRFARAVVEMEREIAKIPMRLNDDYLYGVRQSALILDVSHRTLEGWRSKGKGPHVTELPNGSKKYRGCHLREFMDACSEKVSRRAGS